MVLQRKVIIIKFSIYLFFLLCDSSYTWSKNSHFARALHLDSTSKVSHVSRYYVTGSKGKVSTIWIGEYKTDKHARRTAFVFSAPCKHKQKSKEDHYCLYSHILNRAQEARILGVIDLSVSTSLSQINHVNSGSLDIQNM